MLTMDVYAMILAPQKLGMSEFLHHHKMDAIKYTLPPWSCPAIRLAIIRPKWHLFAFQLTEEQ
jgi:hypothetical protein